MKIVLIVAAALAGGVTLGAALCWTVIRRRVKELRSGETQVSILRSVTRLIFVTTQISALVWVFTSYGIAIYSTVRLQQVYTMAELSEPAIHTILGVGFLKVLENIFEHNEGVVFGKNKQTAPDDDGHERNDL